MTSQTHKCMSRNNGDSICHFCTVCSVLMSKSKNPPIYYRSEQYKVIDLLRLDGNIILKQMIRKQNVNRVYNPRARYIKFRNDLIKFMEYLAERLGYSKCTYYLSISLLDALLSKYAVDKKQMKLVCFIALHIAAKMEEKFENIPEVAVVRQLFDNTFDKDDINTCEMMVAKILGYNFNLKTPFEFVEYFFSRGVVSDQDIGKGTTKLISGKLTSFEKAVMRFIDLSVSSYDFYNYSPVVIAAASIACVRKLEGYQSEWTTDLQNLTGQSESEIRQCINLLNAKWDPRNNEAVDTENKKLIDLTKSRISGIDLKKDGSVESISTSVSDRNIKPNFVTSELIVFDTDEDEPVKNPTKCRFASK